MKKYSEALADFQMALTPPENLRAQEGHNSRKIQITLCIGCAYAALGEKDNAIQSLKEVVESGTRTNKPGPGGGGRGSGNNLLAQKEQNYFIALAQNKLGFIDKSKVVFYELAATTIESLSNQSGNEGDPQFVNSRRQPTRDNLAMPHYIAGLASVEAGKFENGRWIPGRKLSGDDILLRYDLGAAADVNQS